jgi:hypothetical protein
MWWTASTFMMKPVSRRNRRFFAAVSGLPVLITSRILAASAFSTSASRADLLVFQLTHTLAPAATEAVMMAIASEFHHLARRASRSLKARSRSQPAYRCYRRTSSHQSQAKV